MCTIISPSHIICASVGDSRCVVGTCNSGAISLSEDHKPQLADEKKRIEFAGMLTGVTMISLCGVVCFVHYLSNLISRVLLHIVYRPSILY